MVSISAAVRFRPALLNSPIGTPPCRHAPLVAGSQLTIPVALNWFAWATMKLMLRHSLDADALMNPHFDFRREGGELPSAVYARVDSVERDGEDRLLLSFSAVSCDSVRRWLPDFSEVAWARAWNLCWREVAAARRLQEVFDSLDLVYLTVSVGLDAPPWLTQLHEESPWLELQLGGGSDATPALAYLALFASGQQTTVGVAAVLGPTAQAQLNAAFSMRAWPQTHPAQLQHMFSSVHAYRWHVFDVGQGSANGFVEDGPVTLFHDLGCGAYANAKTAPSNTVACHSRDAPIVLSHWDTDHWAGARRFAPPAIPDAFLKRIWVAPFDPTVGVTHVAFALDILAAGGALKILSSASGPTAWMPIKGGRQMRLIKGSGYKRNDSGLALEVRDSSNRRWLATGDVDYEHLSGHLNERYVAIAVPHHGAATSPAASPPKPELGYARLVYSFGRDNTYGHPKQGCISSHGLNGWGHGVWNGTSCGPSASAAHVRSTGCNAPGAGHLGGVIIGWTGAPPCQTGPACGVNCNAYAMQS